MKAYFFKAQILVVPLTLILSSIGLAQNFQPSPVAWPQYLDYSTANTGNATAVAQQQDGKFILAGTFISVNGFKQTNMARINPDGSVDATWNVQYNGVIQTMVINGTDLYIGGTFTNLGNLGINYLAKLSTTNGGVPDPTWTPNPDGPITKLLLNGTVLYVSGSFTNLGGASIPYLAQFNTSDGSVNSLWNPMITGTVFDFALGGTNIFVAGGGPTVGGLTRYGLAKIDAAHTGTTDPLWCVQLLQGIGNGMTQPGAAYCVAANETNVYIGGNFDGFYFPRSGLSNEFQNVRIAKLDATGEGTNDTAWTGDWHANSFRSSVEHILVNGDQVYYTLRDFTVDYHEVFDVSATGTAQPLWSFNNVDSGNPLNFMVLCGGSLIISDLVLNRAPGSSIFFYQVIGLDAATGSQAPPGILYLSADGANLINQLGGTVTASTRLSDGRIAVGGRFIVVGTNGGLNNFTLINPGGASDPIWSPQLPASPSLMVSSGTNIYVVYQSSNSATISRCSSQGSGAVDSWNASVGGTVYCVLPTPTDVFVGGSFTSANGQSWRNLVDLNVTNASVKPGFAINGPVYSLAFVNPYYLYIGGAFGLINGSFQNNLAREFIVNGSNAGLDTSWNPGTIGPVNALAADSANGILYVGGGLTNLAGNTVQHLGRVRTTDAGTFDGSWLPACSGPVTNLSLIGQNLYMLGSFASVGGLARNGIARIATTGDGTPDAYWNLQANGTVNALTVNGPLISAGGNFTTINGAPRSGFALLENWPMILPPGAMTPGGFQIDLASDPGRACRMQASVDLLTWSDLSSVVLAATNTTFTDTNAASSTQKFYRLVSP